MNAAPSTARATSPCSCWRWTSGCPSRPRTPIPVMPAPTCAAPRTSSSRRGSAGWCGTGIAIALPDGYAAFVHPRSGLAARHGLTLVNTPGTIDAGYRGEIKVCLLNTDQRAAVRIARGDRIAQLVVQPVSRAWFVPVAELPASNAAVAATDRPAGY